MTAPSNPYKRWEAVFFFKLPEGDCHALPLCGRARNDKLDLKAESATPAFGGIAMIITLSVIAGMGKGFGNGEGIKSRNGDWEEKIFSN